MKMEGCTFAPSIDKMAICAHQQLSIHVSATSSSKKTIENKKWTEKA
jgi:hypothetical protein